MKTALFRSLFLLPFLYSLVSLFAFGGTKPIVFFDDFSDNKNEWAVENSEGATFEFKNGLYYFAHNQYERSWHVFKTINIDQHRDFEIETGIVKVSGINDNGYGLIWGRQDGVNQFEFQVTGDGYIRIKKYVNNVAYDFVNWTKTAAVRAGNGSTNKLKLEKNGLFFHFYVNDIHVHTMPFEPFMGNAIGYTIYGYQQIAVDYLKISQSRPDDRAPAIGAARRTRVFSDEFNDNFNDWSLQSSDKAALAMHNGFYEFRHLQENGWWSVFKEIHMDWNRNFEIETGILKTSGVQNNGYGLVWGSMDGDNQYEFQIASNGYFKIKKRQSGLETDILPWTTSGAINQGIGASNRLNIVKKDYNIRFYINDAEVFSNVFEPFMGDRIGYLIYQNQGIAMDYLHVSYLEDSMQRDPAEAFFAGNPFDYGKGTRPEYGVSAPEPVVAAHAPAVSFAFKRLALVIGNSEYVHGGNLKNPSNDARAMQGALERLGFAVLRHENCAQKEMKMAIDYFGRKLDGHEVGLFFYAGHGVQVGGANYLIPVDARLELEKDVEYDCVRADRVLAKMEAAGSDTNIVILDACRDNPFERSWRRSGKGGGLAFMNAPSGSLIAYATSPGQTAADGAGTNGIYTGALLEHIQTPGISILQMFQRVRSDVMNRTGDRQVPWESTSLRGDFFFK